MLDRSAGRFFGTAGGFNHLWPGDLEKMAARPGRVTPAGGSGTLRGWHPIIQRVEVFRAWASAVRCGGFGVWRGSWRRPSRGASAWRRSRASCASRRSGDGGEFGAAGAVPGLCSRRAARARQQVLQVPRARRGDPRGQTQARHPRGRDRGAVQGPSRDYARRPVCASSLLRVTSGDPDEVMPPPEAKMPAVTPEEAQDDPALDRGGGVDGALGVRADRGARGAEGVGRIVVGPIDRWVLATLDEEGLRPSVRAERGKSPPRRVSLDVVGLPPTLEEQDAFLADRSGVRASGGSAARVGGLRREVGAVVARPCAVRGLDGVRRPGRTIWPYRDWAAPALNEDMAFDRFTELQLAGDLVKAGSGEESEANLLVMASPQHDDQRRGRDGRRGVPRGGGHRPREHDDGGVARADDGCSQCHTHKDDPLTQTTTTACSRCSTTRRTRTKATIRRCSTS